jgi:hypothetical protein
MPDFSKETYARWRVRVIWWKLHVGLQHNKQRLKYLSQNRSQLRLRYGTGMFVTFSTNLNRLTPCLSCAVQNLLIWKLVQVFQASVPEGTREKKDLARSILNLSIRRRRVFSTMFLGKSPWYPLNRRLRGNHNRYKRLPQPRNEPQCLRC